jgi:hypothetical protein
MRHTVFMMFFVFLVGSVEAGHMIMSDRHDGGRDYTDNRMEGYKYFRWGMHLPDIPGYGCGDGSYSNMEHQGMTSGMRGYGIGPEMWGYGATRNEKFLEDTVDIRRELHNRQFDYNEALRNRDVKHDDIIKMEKGILELQMTIKEKWWNRID